MKERTSKGVEKTLEAWRTSDDVRIKMEAQTCSTSFQFRTTGTAHTKMDAHVAYGVRFGCYLYGWKDNFKKLPMEPVLGPNSSGVNRNRLHKLTSRICSGATTPSFGLLGRVSCQGPFGVRPRGSCMTLETLLAAATSLLGFGVLLELFCQEQFVDRLVCETPTRVFNQSSAIFQIVFFLVLICVFDSQARISPRGEVNRAAHG
jgi:hypothetical protein